MVGCPAALEVEVEYYPDAEVETAVHLWLLVYLLGLTDAEWQWGTPAVYLNRRKILGR